MHLMHFKLRNHADETALTESNPESRFVHDNRMFAERAFYYI